MILRLNAELARASRPQLAAMLDDERAALARIARITALLPDISPGHRRAELAVLQRQHEDNKWRIRAELDRREQPEPRLRHLVAV